MTGRDAVRDVARRALGAVLVGAGVGHLVTHRQEFRAQVPSWLPVDDDVVVVASGVVELLLGAALLVAGRRRAPGVGLVAAGFFVAVFPGNVAQWAEGTDAFGLDSDGARVGRLLLQPVLVAWALWSSGGWRLLRGSTPAT